MYRSTKTFGHDLGISCAFRQWRADSHCRFIHGYALSFHIVFEAEALDERNWVMDFGGLKQVKQAIQDAYDHKLLIAVDDPLFNTLVPHILEKEGAADIRIVERTGCEAFAKEVFTLVEEFLHNTRQYPRVRIVSVECREHGANSAIYLGEDN